MFKKYANAEVVDLVSMNQWNNWFPSKAKSSSFNKIASSQTKYLLTHCTIVASVAVEADPFDHLIKPECSIFVNSNQDAWTNEVLRLSYKSFVGAFNFLEHFQNSKHNKGHIIDAILRKIKVTPEVFIYFVDILVATDLVHEKLVSDIKDQKLKYMSMGCVTDLVVCSFCGTKVTDENNYCYHLQYQKGLFLPDDDGVPRRVAELCGHKSLPNGGCRFVEASWVGTPAFPGAALRDIVADEWLGPKTKYTKAASREGVFKKAANQVLSYTSLEEAKLKANFLNKFKD